MRWWVLNVSGLVSDSKIETFRSGRQKWATRLLCVAVLSAICGSSCEPAERNYGDPSVEVFENNGGSTFSNFETSALATGSSAGTSSPATVTGASVGAACETTAECMSGNCVDGICCDSPCQELCVACNVPGRVGSCSATAFEPLCPPGTC